MRDTCCDKRPEYQESVRCQKITAQNKKIRTKSIPSYILSQLLQLSSKAVTRNVTLVF